MSLPEHVKFHLELAEILASAAALRIRIGECEAVQQTHKTLAEYPIPDGLNVDYADKQQHFERELQSTLDHLVCKYQETSLSTLECFYPPGDAEDVANYGQELIDWISDMRKHLIQLKVETAKILRDKENTSEISSPLPDFLSYEQRLKNIYHSVVKFEQLLKIKSKPALLPLSNPPEAWVPPPSLSQILPETRRNSNPIPHGVALTERLDRIRNTLTTFQTSRPEFSLSLFQIHQKYHLPPLSSQISNAISHAVSGITSESLPPLLSTAKARCQDVLTHNEQAFHVLLGQKLHASFGLIQVVLGATNTALTSMCEDGEII
ncbi:hypothetical protein BYT27DRAFT_7252046 [Phlegmacium glaucopus]|nr:hypothetical protein BYT27DRAFT_7252046 [Phlegmacium glaucopus]